MWDKRRGWPSRPLQVLFFVMPILAAAYQVWSPAASPRARAEQLYVDAWFAGVGAPGSAGRRAALGKLGAALKLDPSSPRYEQAQVWFTDPAKLPSLLAGRGLGPDARALAAGLLYQQALRSALGTPPGGQPRWWETSTATLGPLDDFIAADPENALPHYLKAQILARADRVEEALAEVRAGNALPRVRHTIPAVSDAILNTPVVSAIAADLFPTQARFRDLARFLADTANLRLRQRRVDEARETLEACCAMGVRVAGAEPRALVTLLVGRAVYATGWTDLEPLLKDFGPEGSLDGYRQTSRAFDGIERNVAWFSRRPQAMERVMALSLVSTSLQLAGVIALLLLVLALVGWLMTACAALGAEPVATPTWDWAEGWLARVCLTTYGTAGLLLAGIVAAILSPDGLRPEGPALHLLGLPAAIAPLVPLVVVMALLRRRHYQFTGERVGFAAFLWKSAPSMRVWIHRRLSAALGYQVLFNIALLALGVGLSKPILGAHPWQPVRMPVGTMAEEGRFVSRCVSRIEAAAARGSGRPDRELTP